MVWPVALVDVDRRSGWRLVGDVGHRIRVVHRFGTRRLFVRLLARGIGHMCSLGTDAMSAPGLRMVLAVMTGSTLPIVCHGDTCTACLHPLIDCPERSSMHSRNYVTPGAV